MTSAFYIFILLTPLLFVAAGLCNSVMDRVETENKFNESVFSKKDLLFWSKAVSWRNKYEYRSELNPIRRLYILGARTPFEYTPLSDAWHRFKLAMVACFCLAGCCAVKAGTYVSEWSDIEMLLLLIGLFTWCGIGWNVGFNWGYNGLFKR